MVEPLPKRSKIGEKITNPTEKSKAWMIMYIKYVKILPYFLSLNSQSPFRKAKTLFDLSIFLKPKIKPVMTLTNTPFKKSITLFRYFSSMSFPHF